MKALNRTLLWVAVFAIAMGVLEGAVVIYLRKIYFPGGFQFPLRPVELEITIVELWREIATLVMLATVGILAGRNRGERFAYFLYAFGIWDIVYYAFLKLMLGWPESLMTWDILFLLPVPWVGPVITPCIIASIMIAFGITTARFTDAGVPVHMTPTERALLWIGALIDIIAFTLEWTQVEGPQLWSNIRSDNRLDYHIGSYVPSRFPWWIFIVGTGMILTSFFLFRKRLSGLLTTRLPVARLH